MPQLNHGGTASLAAGVDRQKIIADKHCPCRGEFFHEAAEINDRVFKTAGTKINEHFTAVIAAPSALVINTLHALWQGI